MADPFEQFKITPIINLELLGYDVSFTNASLFMILAIFAIFALFYLPFRSESLVPSRWQVVAESIYEFVEKMINDTCGEKGKKYMPYIFSLFTFVMFCNLLGMVPYSFTVTSHIIVSFLIAFSLFVFITILGFVKHGFSFLRLFLPSGTPWWMAPLMVFIELFTYFSRPISLSVRLTANMIAGHVLLKVLAGFVVMMGVMIGWLPIPLIAIMTGFEIFIALLQAYIFSILACVYLNDALNGGH